MTDLILWSLWYFVPAGVGNTAPIIAAKLPLLKDWNTPIDLGHKYKGERIFGDHKTVRGFVIGVVAGGLTGAVQMMIARGYDLSFLVDKPVNYQSSEAILLGCVLAFGALFGDALKSFFKRRTSIDPGKSWFPFDQLDYIIGGCVFGGLVAVLSFSEYATILIIWFAMHLIFSYLGYKLKLKKDPI